jgi:hypothetical protein
MPNPKRRVLTVAGWRRNPQAAAALLDRKPRLLRPLLMQLLPRPAKPLDPAERLGISVQALRTAADMQQVMQRVCSAVAAGEIGIREAGRLARQVRTRMRALRRLARLERRLARLATLHQPSNSHTNSGSGNRGNIRRRNTDNTRRSSHASDGRNSDGRNSDDGASHSVHSTPPE